MTTIARMRERADDTDDARQTRATRLSKPWSRAARRLVVLTPALFAVIVYAFICAAGRRGAWPVEMNYYDLLADGFRSGHLYLPVEPDKLLLAQADPYDPKHSAHWMWDASLYRGHYYLYWGPVPALLQAAAKSAFGIHGSVGDQYLVFAAFSLSALGGGLLIDRIARLFEAVPLWLRMVMVAAFAFANPAPHLVASAGVYQASIGWGQAFALAGLLAAFDCVYAAPTRRSDLRLALAGVLWALAIGSRISLLPALTLLAVSTIAATAWPAAARWPTAAVNAALITAPLLVGCGSLLAYNWLRFERCFEFGIHNQLSGLKFSASSSYWLTNLYSYTLRPYFPSCRFPFALAPWWPGTRAFPETATLPPGYLINEPVVGWLRVVPIAWLMVVVPIAVQRRLRLLGVRGRGARSAPALERSPRTFLWCTASFLLLASVSGFAVMGLYMSTMRYLSDVTNGLVLLGILGSFSLYSWAKSRDARLTVAFVCCPPALATIVFGLLLGYQGYGEHFKTHNPELDAKITAALSVCR